MTDYTEWTRDTATYALKNAIRGHLDNDYDDEAQMFFSVKFGDESLIVTVSDATDDSLEEEFILNFT